MKNVRLLLLFMLVGGLTVTAQNSDTKKADKLFANFEFDEAIKLYKELVDKGEGNTYIYSKLADANYNIFNTVEAEKWYRKTVKENLETEIVFKYAEMLRANVKYRESNKWMAKFAKMNPNDIRAQAFRQKPDYISEILMAGDRFEVKNLKINTKHAEFGGVVEGDVLYITSAGDDNKEYVWNKEPFLDIYEYSIEGDELIDREKLSKDINTRFHEGLLSFTPDGRTVYFSRESFFDNVFELDTSNTKLSQLHLFKATKGLNRRWENVESLSINSKDFTVKNPSVSSDGKIIYYSSDMPGGFGKYDLYKSEIKEDGSLGAPINLGDHINTEGQEMFPYISDSNTLYFSSNGNLGLGGMDVFFTQNLEDPDEPIRNIGMPVNSNGDDFAFNFNEDTGKGYVSSNRVGGKGSDDIYKISRTRAFCEVILNASVKNSETGEPLPLATATLYDKDGNILGTRTTNAKGLAQFRLECDKPAVIKAVLDNYKDDKVNVEKSSVESQDFELVLDPKDKIIVEDRILLAPIYFDYDQSYITTLGSYELDRLVSIMIKYPDIVIKARSHTDSRGKDDYNRKLSEDRAKATVKYVVSKGVNASRISGEGLGESEPLYDCGKKCTEEQHQYNRRSEFLIVSGGPKNR